MALRRPKPDPPFHLAFRDGHNPRWAWLRASPDQFGAALAAVEKGPLPQAVLDRIAALQEGFSGEVR